MKKALRHLRIHIFRGFLAIIPLALSFLVIRFLYLAIDTRVTGVVEKFLGFKIPGLGIVLVLVVLYLIGLAASHWVGRRFFGLVDLVTTRIPLIKTVYLLGRQIAEAFSVPEKQAFKKAVMVEHFRPGLWSIGFLAGAVSDRENKEEKLLKVFIPTAPNPTTGFMVMVKESQVRVLDWTVNEAMNAILSGGIIGPKEV